MESVCSLARLRYKYGEGVRAYPVPGGTCVILGDVVIALDLPGKGDDLNHHWTKSLLASADGKRLYIGVGSNSRTPFKTRDLFGSSLALWWAFENFIDIAPYIGDARAGELPLIGGNYGSDAPYGFHDWNFILNELHVLDYDTQVSHAALAIGYAGMTFCLLWGLWTLIYVKVFQKDEFSI